MARLTRAPRTSSAIAEWILPMKTPRILIAISLFFLHAPHVWAAAQATSDLRFLSLQITPTAGAISFAGPWDVSAFAQGANSLAELDVDFQSNPGGPIAANAAVTYANAHGDANGLSLTGNAESNVFIPGTIEAFAASAGRGTLSNSFMITGGVGDVSVTFSLGMSGVLQALTDAFGLQAETELIVNMQLDGDPVLFYTDLLSIGPNSSAMRPVSQTLTEIRTLHFNTPYFLLAEADSESRGINAIPEPSNALIGSMLLCSVALTALSRPRRASLVS